MRSCFLGLLSLALVAGCGDNPVDGTGGGTPGAGASGSGGAGPGGTGTGASSTGGSGTGGAKSSEWAKSYGGAGRDSGQCIVADKSGNIYVGGYFTGSASFGGVKLESPAVGGFVAKLSPEGSVIWATAIPSTDVADVRAIAIDPEGNVQLAGLFSGTATFGTKVFTAGIEDAFVASLDAKGAFRWALSTGTDAFAMALGLALDEKGDIYVAGSVKGTGALGGAPLATVDEDAFVAKVDAQGTVLWVTLAGGTSATQAHAIAVRPGGEAVIAGSFYGLPGDTVQAGDFTLTSQGSNDVLVLVLQPDGKVKSARSFGGPNWDEGWAVAVDAAGGAYIAGQFVESSTFGSKTLESAGYGLFLAALDPSGDLVWVASGGGPADATVVSVLADGAGNAYLTGLFSGQTTFGGTTLTGAGSWDLYLARVSSSGVFDWAVQAGGAGADYGRALAFAPSGELLVTGFFEESAAVGVHTVESVGGLDVLVCKLPASFGEKL